MKTAIGFIGLAVAVVLGGCVAAAPYGYYGQYAPQQYMAPVQQVAPAYVGCQYPYVPAPHGCVMPSSVMYMPMYPVYGYGPWIGGGYRIRLGKGSYLFGRW